MRGHLCGPCLALLGLVLLASPLRANDLPPDEFMDKLDERYSEECNLEMIARWDYITDVKNTSKEEAANEAAVRYMGFKGEAAVNCTEYDYNSLEDVELYRRFRFLSKQGPGALDTPDLMEYKDLQANMETIYSTATICDYHDPNKCDLELEPDIEEIMATSRDWDELQYVWEQWREKTGKLMRDDYTRFVELSNKAATLDGFSDTGYYWLNGYTVDQREADTYTDGHTVDVNQFRGMLSDVWNQVSEGLYKKLHAYVRMRLRETYPDKISSTGLIPAHILGNMWAQTWGNIAPLVMPFPDMPTYDVTDSMVQNGWDIDQMFETAEDFFNSIGLFPMTDEFWEYSVINQTEWGKDIVCHASAEDFCLGPKGNDYRIKMCTEVNMEDLITVHHEMGHIEYFMAYKNQPHVFRDSANPGFHEAIGDLIALSVSTPKHLENVLGLTPTSPTSVKASDYTDEEKKELNFLMKMALDKIAFLPFGYLIDKYRWGVFDGSISNAELNAGWWNLRESLQGVTPPDGERGEEFFDPGAKYHVPANVPYIRYFVSFIVQFQFHKTLCNSTGYTGPLHTCDIYNNTVAGDILRGALEKGFSEPWPEVLKELGGSEDIDPQAIVGYFDPLIRYLDKALEENHQCIGWGDDCAVSPTDEVQARIDMDDMDSELTELVQRATECDWAYYTNVSDAASNIANEAWGNVSRVFRDWYVKTIALYEYESFEDETLKRRFRLQKNLDTAALSDEDLNEFNTIVKNMTTIYGNARVLKEDNDTVSYGIDELEVMMAEIRKESDLKYYWKEWRDVSGKLMQDNYKRYITLLNKAATATENGFADAGEMWVDGYAEPTLNYTADDFKDEIRSLWDNVSEFYKNLHAYVRYKLVEEYGDEVVDSKFIPAHLLGNMWAQSWENIYDIVAPFPKVAIPDISNDLQENIEDVHEMVRIAEDFYTSLGLNKMTDDFWHNSVFEQNEQETVICHASAWDFYDVVEDPSQGRFRIKMCTDKNQEDFTVIHHEMGHTQYQMSYSVPKGERPLVFRDGANPGFHEAIGDTIALSVSTPRHLDMISDYLNNRTDSGNVSLSSFSDIERDYGDDDLEYQQNINFLMKTALAKIAFLPYAYILDQYRWELFSNGSEYDDFNRKWWSLRLDVQGICPPDTRHATDDFDPGSKYHVADNVPYIRYFVAHILQFQFHRRLCAIAFEDEFDETQVFNCDIYGSTKAGDALYTMLNTGASVEWHTQLKTFMNSPEGNMDATAILDYFSPLQEFLADFIKENDIEPGWELGKVDDYVEGDAYIPATVPIVVGVVLAVMVLIVIVAYFVGRHRQKKKKAKDSGMDNPAFENIEITAQTSDAKSVGSSDSD